MGAPITADNWNELFDDGNPFTYGTPEMVSKALASYPPGLVVNSSDSNGWTPLMYAAMVNPNPEIINLLIDAGSNLEARDGEGGTALSLASSFNDNPEVVSILIEAGSDLEAKNHKGKSPLMLSLEFNLEMKVVSRLLQHGARFEEIESLDSLLNAVIQDSNIESASHLLEAGVDLESRAGVFDGTPLLEGAAMATPAMVSFLLEAGADIEAEDSLGMTPLLRAAFNNPDPESIFVLLKSGANVEARFNGLSALDLTDFNYFLKESEGYQKLIEALRGE